MNRDRPVPLWLPGVLELHGRYLRDKPAVVGAETLTYGDLVSLAGRVQRWAAAEGLTGRRIATVLAPSEGHVVVLVGLLAAGAVVCPVNTRLTASERGSYLASLDPALVVVGPEYATGSGRESVLDLADASHPMSQRLPAAAEPTRPWAIVDETAPAIAFPTGGTTGLPKAGLWTHRSLLLALSSSCQHLEVRRDDVELFFSPFFHLTIVTGMMSTLVAGGTVRLLPRYDEGEVAATLARVPITRLFGTPAALERLADRAPAHGWPSVRSVIYGAGRSWPDLPDRLRRMFPSARLFTGYGATEFGAVTRLYDDEIARGVAGVGRPVAGVELRVVDEALRPLPPGEEGELLVRSPWQMVGYLGREGETPFHEGFVRSGDIARIGDDGHVVLVDRRSDVIKSGGEAVYPSEVEAVLRAQPGIADCAVFGRLDRVRGERVEAAVVLERAATVDLDHVLVSIRSVLASYKVPHVLHVVDELPLTSNLKLDRRRLRSELG